MNMVMQLQLTNYNRSLKLKSQIASLPIVIPAKGYSKFTKKSTKLALKITHH